MYAQFFLKPWISRVLRLRHRHVHFFFKRNLESEKFSFPESETLNLKAWMDMHSLYTLHLYTKQLFIAISLSTIFSKKNIKITLYMLILSLSYFQDINSRKIEIWIYIIFYRTYMHVTNQISIVGSCVEWIVIII